MAQLIRKALRAVLRYDPSFCDMFEDSHARVAATEYLDHIRRHIRERFGKQRLSILDAGCQAGRLLIPLAEDGHRLVGVDASPIGIRRARRHARERGLSVQLYTGDLAQLRRWIRPESVDVVVCAEVLYLCQEHQQIFQLLLESVKSGGLLFISHRPMLHYVGAALRQGNLELASSVIRRSEGLSPDGAYNNWQTEEQLDEWYRLQGCRLLDCYPVDHHTPFQFDASLIADAELRRLLEPLRGPDSTFSIPQYLLVAAQKNQRSEVRCQKSGVEGQNNE